MHTERKSCCFPKLSTTCNVQPLRIFLPLLSTRSSCNSAREYPCSNKSVSHSFTKLLPCRMACFSCVAHSMQRWKSKLSSSCKVSYSLLLEHVVFHSLDVLKSYLITMSSLHPTVCFGHIVLVSKFYCYKEGQLHISDIETV